MLRYKVDVRRGSVSRIDTQIEFIYVLLRLGGLSRMAGLIFLPINRRLSARLAT